MLSRGRRLTDGHGWTSFRPCVAAVDALIARGDLDVIRNNRLQYAVLSEERYRELVAAEQEAHCARVRAPLEDVKAGRVKTFKTADELLKALDEEG